MKKSTYIILFCIAAAVMMTYVANSSLFGIIECHCADDSMIIQNCGSFCALSRSYCTYYELKTASCFGTMCNSTWVIQCENGDDTKSGGARECGDCIEDDDEEPGVDWHHPDFYE